MAKARQAGNNTNGAGNNTNGAGKNNNGDANETSDDGNTNGTGDGNGTKKEDGNADESKRLRSLDTENGGCVPIPELGITCPDPVIADGNKNDAEPSA